MPMSCLIWPAGSIRARCRIRFPSSPRPASCFGASRMAMSPPSSSGGGSVRPNVARHLRTKMHVRPDLSFVPDAALEIRAGQLLQRYTQAYGPVTEFPVPVEHIADLLLELDLLWEPIPDGPAVWTLAYL